MIEREYRESERVIGYLGIHPLAQGQRFSAREIIKKIQQSW